jgi:hypothetical protein
MPGFLCASASLRESNPFVFDPGSLIGSEGVYQLFDRGKSNACLDTLLADMRGIPAMV